MGRLRKGKKYLKKADAGDKRYWFGRKAEILSPKISEKHSTGFSGRVYTTPDSRIFKVAHDVSTELALIKAYGNAVVPWIPYVILKFILEIERSNS